MTATFVLVLVHFHIFLLISGEFTVMYLFTRFRFNWNEVQYSIWSTYSVVTNLIGKLYLTVKYIYITRNKTLVPISQEKSTPDECYASKKLKTT